MHWSFIKMRCFLEASNCSFSKPQCHSTAVQPSSRDDSWSLSHSVATSLPIVRTYSLSVRHSPRSLSLCLPCRWSDLRPSMIWQACHSDDCLSAETSYVCESFTLNTPKSKKNSQARSDGSPLLVHPPLSCPIAVGNTKFEVENIGQAEEHIRYKAWWVTGDRTSRGLDPVNLRSHPGGKGVLWCVKPEPVTADQEQQTDIFLSIFHYCVGDYESRRQVTGFKVSSRCPLDLSSMSHAGKNLSETVEVSSNDKTLAILKDKREDRSNRQVIVAFTEGPFTLKQ